MKAKEREIYVALSDEIDYGLCAFCRYAKVEVCGCPECTHPLEDRLNFWEESVYPGDDCWLFRPLKGYTITDFAEITGIILSEGWQESGWNKREDGMIEVYGTHNFI